VDLKKLRVHLDVLFSVKELIISLKLILN